MKKNICYCNYKLKKKYSAGKLFADRSSHQRCSIKKGFLKNFTKFTGKHMYQSLYFHKVTSFRSATLLRKRLWHRCFPVNFAKFLRTPFLQSTSGRLLLWRYHGVETILHFFHLHQRQGSMRMYFQSCFFNEKIIVRI